MRPGQDRHLQSCEPAEVARQRVIDTKSHREPRDRQRCQNGHHHELVQVAVQHDHCCRLLCVTGPVEQFGKREALAGGGVAGRVGEDCPVETDQQHQRCVDPLAVIREDRGDGASVTGGDRFAKRIVGGGASRLHEAFGVLLQKTVEYPRPGNNLGADRFARGGHAPCR